MLSSAFYDSGSVLTMGDFKTYACLGINSISSGSSSEIPSGSLTHHMDFKAFILSPEFSLNQIQKKWHISDLQELKANDLIPDQLLMAELKAFNWSADIDVYNERYKEIKKLITEQKIKKAVPFVTYKLNKPKSFNQKYLPQILNHLITHKPESEYIYGFWNGSQGFIGCTPEFLIQQKNFQTNSNLKSTDHKLTSCIQTMALAGTLPSNSSVNMLKDQKLKEEHRFVIDDISEKLKDLKMVWSDPIEKNYGLVKHIHAIGEFETNDQLSIENLIQRLSPTSALGVYPKEKLNDLRELLAMDTRGSYGAPFGYVLEDQFNIIVALRGLFWDDKFIYIHVGGGVTEKSELQKELDELELKFLSTKKKLGL